MGQQQLSQTRYSKLTSKHQAFIWLTQNKVHKIKKQKILALSKTSIVIGKNWPLGSKSRCLSRRSLAHA